MAYKVLFFVDRMRVGGIQVLLWNLQNHFNHDVIHCDYLVLDDGEAYEYEEMFRSTGANVYKLNGIWLDSPQGYIAYRKAMDQFFKEHHDYVAVHMNASSKNFMLLYYAKKYGIKKRIVHSHNTGFQTHNPLKKIVGDIFKIPMMKYATDYFACSEIAGEWLFGKNNVRSGKVYIMPNAIDLDKFEFKQSVRNKVRQELGLSENQILIGHVGRFTIQKNHKYLLQIFAKVHQIAPEAVLILVGIGELMNEMKDEAEKLGIADVVRFLGFRNDVNDLTQAMDVFLMPSFYEGFPVTGIEAQASGCPCVFSDTITREAALLDDTVFINLSQSPEIWAKIILELAKKNMNRSECKQVLKEKGFDIKETVNFLEEFYIS